MFKLYRLRREVKLVSKLKLQEIKNQNFETAALHRDNEKMILLEIANLKQKQNLIKNVRDGFKSFLFIRFSFSIYGLFIQHGPKNVPIRLEGYSYSEWITIYINAMFSEMPHAKFYWEDNEGRRKKLIEEVTEYYFIKQILSHFQTDYMKFRCEITRNKVENLLKSNCFLDLFSKSMDERKIFLNDDKLSGVKFIFARDENDNVIGLFEEFHYKFPYKCTLKREGSFIIFSTPFLKIKFNIWYEGAVAPLPIDFGRFYLGFIKNSGQRVNASLQLFIKWPVYIFPKYWGYIRTIYSLKKGLIESFSSDYFFNSFNWESIYIQSRIIENIITQKQKNFN